MAYRISAEKKKYPRDEGYQEEHDYESAHLTDYDKRIMVKRIRQENANWVANKVIGWILVAVFLLIILPGMLAR